MYSHCTMNLSNQEVSLIYKIAQIKHERGNVGIVVGPIQGLLTQKVPYTGQACLLSRDAGIEVSVLKALIRDVHHDKTEN
jgi:hypothetical protein